MTSTLIRSSWLLVLPALLVACSGSDDGDGDGNGGSGNDAGSSGTGNQNGGNGGSSNDGGTAGNTQGGNAGDSASGNGGMNNGGTSNGGAGGSSNGGAGPGIPTDGEVFCANEAADAATAFYFGVASTCYVFKAATESFTDQQKTLMESVCTALYGGTVVTACPAEETPVAYCAGEQLLAGVSTSVTRIIYESDVNPDAATVSKNSLAVCGALSLYDLNDQKLVSTCTGTMTANVDGTPVDFSDQLVCLFRTDGTKSTYLVRGYESLNAVNGKELTVKVIKDGAADVAYFEEVLQPPVGYLEGGGVFGFPVGENTLSVAASSYAMEGSGFAASFEIGSLSSSPNSEENVRVITDGELDIQISE